MTLDTVICSFIAVQVEMSAASEHMSFVHTDMDTAGFETFGES